MDQNSMSRPKCTLTVPARLSVFGEAGAAAGFGSSKTRQMPEQLTPLTSDMGATAQPLNSGSQGGFPSGVREVKGAHLTQGAPRLPEFTACGGGSSSGTFCNPAVVSNAMTRVPWSSLA